MKLIRRWVFWAVLGGMAILAVVAVVLGGSIRTSPYERLLRDGGVEITIALDVSQVQPAQRAAVAARAAKIYEDRLDMFKSELKLKWASVIQSGDDRLTIMIAGVTDSAMIDPSSRTMRPLELWTVADSSEYRVFLSELESRLASDTALQEIAGLIMVNQSPEEVIGGLCINTRNEPAVRVFFDSPKTRALASPGVEFGWDFRVDATQNDDPIRRLYLLRDKAGVSGTDIEKVKVERALDGSSRVVCLEFTKEGSQRLAALTTRMVGKRLAVVWRSQVITAPIVREVVLDGRLTLGDFSKPEAEDLATLLRGGSIPAPMEVLSCRLIPAGQR
jgi:hypothetical protein